MHRLHRFFALVFAFAVSSATAGTLSFDDAPATNSNDLRLAEQYADRGIHFHTNNDGSTWDGISKGDPGLWGLEGSNGSTFVGFNGGSYGLAATFDTPVTNLRIDVAPSLGNAGEAGFMLEGYRAGTLVERVVVPLGAVGEWSTVGLASDVDGVRWYATGDAFRPFGIDNLRWRPVEPAIGVDVNIHGDGEAPIDPRAGLLGAVVRGSAGFDVHEIDETTLALGPAGTGVVNLTLIHVKDVNGDGWQDLVTLYDTAKTGLVAGDEELCLTGETFSGIAFEGCDGIWTLATD